MTQWMERRLMTSPRIAPYPGRKVRQGSEARKDSIIQPGCWMLPEEAFPLPEGMYIRPV